MIPNGARSPRLGLGKALATRASSPLPALVKRESKVGRSLVCRHNGSGISRGQRPSRRRGRALDSSNGQLGIRVIDGALDRRSWGSNGACRSQNPPNASTSRPPGRTRCAKRRDRRIRPTWARIVARNAARCRGQIDEQALACFLRPRGREHEGRTISAPRGTFSRAGAVPRRAFSRPRGRRGGMRFVDGRRAGRGCTSRREAMASSGA